MLEILDAVGFRRGQSADTVIERVETLLATRLKTADVHASDEERFVREEPR
ncbi:hypothetical protein [Nocardia sp. NPDC004711]